ncbi:MAG: phytanoyl-CoA dioxygenase family protein [Bacteriovoracaceae bacterium]|nr:phytanoyl-CoA dioxygenase family protein [Bacteriovoracaceae bacterium]
MKDSRILSDFKENGYLHVKGFYSLDLISKIKNSLVQEVKKNLRNIPGADKKFSGGKVEFIAQAQKHLSSDFNNLFNIDSLNDLVDFLLEESASLFTSEVLFKRAETGFGYRPHQDAVYFCSKENRGLNTWTPLEASGLGNGGIWYIPGSHLLGELPHKAHNFNDFSCDLKSLTMKGLEKLLPEAAAGDLLIHDCLMVHGSAPNKSQNRRIAISRFYLPKSNLADSGKLVLNKKRSLLVNGDFKKVE